MNKKHSYLIQLGKKIKLARRQKGFSLKKLAASTGLDYYYLAQVEQGKKALSVQEFIQIALILQLEIKKLAPTLKQLQHKAH